MTTFVVDASVAAKWMLTEEHGDKANSLASGQHTLLAPDLIVAELGNVLRKACLAGGLPIPLAMELAGALPLSGLELSPSAPLLRAAFDVALRYQRSIYDALYVTLALRERCQLVTADLRLHNALKDALPGTMLWIGDV